ncbi:phage major capsid protein [Acidovorax sp. BLS4]|uniref:phage major capsid protein n=1 Tax=Acidovorax sp. BLS4 TaxID=3273430 RepID=UPI0029434F41|nr:phage major capsid protein [Paracidovorax avenae]WOI43778.1 phage major capsid protein [Paracidovorax avenae]
MSQVLKLRSERAQLNVELQALAKKESEGASLSADDLAKFGELEAKINALTGQITRAEAAERLNATNAVPLNESAQGNASPPAHISVSDNQPAGAKMAQMARLLAAAQGDQRMAADLATKGGFGSDVAMALNTVTAGAGGVLVPENFASSVIESLRPFSVVRRMGCQSIPLNNGNMTMPRILGNTTVSYIGSDTDIPVTGMTFGDLKLAAKKAAALVPISNDLLAYAGVSPRVDAIVSGDLQVSMGLSEDLHFIRSDGTGSKPKGLRYWALAGNIVVAPADPTLQQVEAYLGGLMLRLEMANVSMSSCGWLLSPRTVRWLGSLRDGNGNKAFPEIETGKLKGYPFALTTQIPVNLGAGGDESEIYFVNFADMFIGEDMQLVIAYSTEASYKDGNGETVSAFQRDQTLVRVIAKHDFGPRHVESVVVGTQVKWGKAMLA